MDIQVPTKQKQKQKIAAQWGSSQTAPSPVGSPVDVKKSSVYTAICFKRGQPLLTYPKPKFLTFG